MIADKYLELQSLLGNLVVDMREMDESLQAQK